MQTELSNQQSNIVAKLFFSQCFRLMHGYTNVKKFGVEASTFRIINDGNFHNDKFALNHK